MPRLRALSSICVISTILMVACDSKAPPAASTPTAASSPATAKLDTSHARKVSTGVPDGQTFKGLAKTNSLPYVIQLGKQGDLRIEDEGKSNIIFDGDATLGLDSKLVAGEKPLRIQNFATTTDTVLIQVDVGQSTDTTLVGQSSDDGSAPVLVDTKKDRYFPVGYYYEDETKLKIRFTPGDPIQDFARLPSLSRSRPAQKLTLLYRVSAGRSVKYFALSNSAMIEYDPPLAVSSNGR
jgi:hypothetical protein